MKFEHVLNKDTRKRSRSR